MFFSQKLKSLNNFVSDSRPPMDMKVALLGAQDVCAGPGFGGRQIRIIMSEITDRNWFWAETGVAKLSPWAMS